MQTLNIKTTTREPYALVDARPLGYVDCILHRQMTMDLFNVRRGIQQDKHYTLRMTVTIGHKDAWGNFYRAEMKSTEWNTRKTTLEAAIEAAKQRFPGLVLDAGGDDYATGHIKPRPEWKRWAKRAWVKRHPSAA